MFQDVFEYLALLFKAEKLELSEKEIECIDNKDSPKLRDGITFISNHGNGQIVLTKTVDSNMEIGMFLSEVLKLLCVLPGIIAIDANGFVKKDNDLVFTWASPGSGILLHNGKNKLLIDSSNTTKKLVAYCKSLTNVQFGNLWFERHNAISDLMSSGFSAK